VVVKRQSAEIIGCAAISADKYDAFEEVGAGHAPPA
jgi:hypothetical protein